MTSSTESTESDTTVKTIMSKILPQSDDAPIPHPFSPDVHLITHVGGQIINTKIKYGQKTKLNFVVSTSILEVHMYVHYFLTIHNIHLNILFLVSSFFSM